MLRPHAAAFLRESLAVSSDSTRLPHALRLFADFAAFCNVTLSNPRGPAPRPRSLTAARSLLIDTATAAAFTPSPVTFRAFQRAASALSAVILSLHDKATPTRLMSRNVPALDNPAPKPHRVPSGSLDWQTHPTIGIDPYIALLQAEQSRILKQREQYRKHAPETPNRAPKRHAQVIHKVRWTTADAKPAANNRHASGSI